MHHLIHSPCGGFLEDSHSSPARESSPLQRRDTSNETTYVNGGTADVFEGDTTDGGARTRGATGDDDYGDGHDQVPGVKQKWKLLPHFLKLRGLMRQHIDSYDYFVNVDISKVKILAVCGRVGGGDGWCLGAVSVRRTRWSTLGRSVHGLYLRAPERY